MATASVIPTETEKITKLTSAVAGLNQMRQVLPIFSSFFDSLTRLFVLIDAWFCFYCTLRCWITDRSSEFWLILFILVVICSENEKSGFINLVSRYLRYSEKHCFLLLFEYYRLDFVWLLGKLRNEKENEYFWVLRYDSFWFNHLANKFEH